MFGSFGPRYMPCSECGGSVAVGENDQHVCERERWLDYQLFQHRDEIAAFDGEVAAYLSSPHGRFEVWCAERARSRNRHRRR